MKSQQGLSLHEVADALGVHYMTVYRYVRQGHLEATKSGSTWEVTPSDLERFRLRSGTRPAARSQAPWDERLAARMVAGDTPGAWAVVEAALASGHEPTAIYSKVLAPALAEIGDRWEAGELGIVDEHIAAAVAARIIGRLGPRFGRRGRSKGTVITAMPQGELHGFGSAMLADTVRAAGFTVLDLGANTPVEAMVSAVERLADVRAVCISINIGVVLDEAAAMIAAVKRLDADLPVYVGGRSVDEPTAVALAADGWGASLEDVEPLLVGG